MLLKHSKEYEAVVHFGVETDTYDKEGRILWEKHSDHLTAADVLAAKVSGTLVLDEVLAGIDLDFLVLFSSVSAIMS